MRRLAGLLVLLAALTALAGATSGAATRGRALLPDLRLVVPTNLISIGLDGSGHRELRFTHITADVGPGLFEIDPHYDAKTGVATFTQALHRRNGSIAKRSDTVSSDIDLMIISDSLTYGEVFGALERVTRAVGRKINPTVYTAAEFLSHELRRPDKATRLVRRLGRPVRPDRLGTADQPRRRARRHVRPPRNRRSRARPP